MPKTISGKLSIYYFTGLVLSLLSIIFTPFIAIIYIMIGFPFFIWITTKGMTQKFGLCFIAWFSDKMMPIQLIDYQGDIKNTMAFKLPDNSWYSWVYWEHQIGEIYLLENGKIDRELSEASYIYWWCPLRESDRVQQKLTYDVPDFDVFVDLPPAKRKKLLNQPPYRNYE